MEGEYNPWRWPLRINQQSQNFHYTYGSVRRPYPSYINLTGHHVG